METRLTVNREGREHFEFPFNDKYGRAIGVTLQAETWVFTEVTPETENGPRHGYGTDAPGTEFRFIIQPTRNGQDYQKSTTSKAFGTIAERTAAWEKYLAKAAKDAAKKA